MGWLVDWFNWRESDDYIIQKLNVEHVLVFCRLHVKSMG